MISKFVKGLFSGVVTGIILGMAVGVSATYYFARPREVEVVKVKTVKIQGADIYHEKVKIRGNKVSFVTTAKGEGKARTEITIPYKKHSVQTSVIFEDERKFSLGYLYNCENVIRLGGGVIVSTNEFKGVYLAAQYSF